MRKAIFLSAAVSISILHFTACDGVLAVKPMESKIFTTSETNSSESGAADVGSESTTLPEEIQDETKEIQSGTKEIQGETEEIQVETKEFQGEPGEKEEGIESNSEAGDGPQGVPRLPGTGRRLEDFVPDGWEILDKVELDFNQDGISDYIGVLDVDWEEPEGDRILRIYQDYPRILFAIASQETDGYCLDFQDINLIRTRNEGGVFGDPYLPLTAGGTWFTTHAYGGSGWKWSEDSTYTYRDGTWWLTLREATSGYGAFITSYTKNDWEKGVGIRKKRSEFSDLLEFVESEEYDLVYELPLDEPLTLEQAGKRSWWALDRVTDWEVEGIVFPPDVELSEEEVWIPEKAADLGYARYCDEDCVLYTFHTGSDTDGGFYYLARYCWQDKVLSVLAKEESEIGGLELYGNKIYYSTEIRETAAGEMMTEGEEQTAAEESTVGIRLNRMGIDGTRKETIFEYRYQEEGHEMVESRTPYLALIYEISKDEMIVEVYIGDEPHPFYRMKTDGSGQKRIGQMPKE